MGVVLKGGTIATAQAVYPADIRIAGQTIDAIGANVARPDDEIVDISGCYAFPGGIDPHTHFDLNVGITTTADDFFTGTKAAVLGGTTTVIDFATQSRGGSLNDALSAWHAKASGKSYIDYGFHLAVCDLNEQALAELPLLASAHGVASVKLYLAYKDVLQVDDATLFKMLRLCRQHGILICLHCENGDVIGELVAEAKAAGNTAPKYHALTRPVTLEAEAVFRAIALAEAAGAPLYIVHVSSGRALSLIADARRRGIAVYAETCPQYLLLDESCYDQAGFAAAKYVMSPPLRGKDDQAQLWQGLAAGRIATVGSDHCSFNLHGQKELGLTDFSAIPNGAPGVENRLGLLYTYGFAAGKIDLPTLVAATATNAAKLFGLYPRKGTIAAGSDADIVVWDPAVHWTIEARTQVQNVDYNAYEGFTQVGKARHVYLRGNAVVKDGALQGEPDGIYLARSPFIPWEGP